VGGGRGRGGEVLYPSVCALALTTKYANIGEEGFCNLHNIPIVTDLKYLKEEKSPSDSVCLCMHCMLYLWERNGHFLFTASILSCVGFLSGIFSSNRDDFYQKFLKVQKL
jgi:hypothetical protein